MEVEKSFSLYPLGGLGEIGMNCMLYKTEKSMVMVDCGLMFPEDYHFGVDVVIPCFDFVIKNKAMLNGIVLTHGHEDHIGALPWLLQHVDVPVYGSEFTLGLVENKLREHDLERWADLRSVRPYDRVLLGDFRFNFFPVCHSIIEGFGLGIETPAGRVVHTGDFKIDRNPMGGHATDLGAFRKFSEPGVRVMLSDSTNVGSEGFALTEREIKVSLREIFSKAKGRILVSLFASHIQRIQEIFDLADAEGRKVAVSGKSLHRNIETGSGFGLSEDSQGHVHRVGRAGCLWRFRNWFCLLQDPRASPWPHCRAWPWESIVNWWSSRTIWSFCPPGSSRATSRPSIGSSTTCIALVPRCCTRRFTVFMHRDTPMQAS